MIAQTEMDGMFENLAIILEHDLIENATQVSTKHCISSYHDKRNVQSNVNKVAKFGSASKIKTFKNVQAGQNGIQYVHVLYKHISPLDNPKYKFIHFHVVVEVMSPKRIQVSRIQPEYYSKKLRMIVLLVNFRIVRFNETSFNFSTLVPEYNAEKKKLDFV